MNSSIVSETATKLRGSKTLTTKLFVEMMVKSLGCTANISLVDLESQDYITNINFWQELADFAIEFGELNKADVQHEFEKVVKGFEKIFDATKNKRNVFIIWKEITEFLSELPKRCKNWIFLVFAVAFSVKLLAHLISIKNFKDDVNIEQSMSFCLDCVSQAANAVAFTTLDVTSDHIYTELIFSIDEFIVLAATDDIFLADSFEDVTSEILENATKIADGKTILKYYNLIESTMKSKDKEVRTKMFQHCTKLNVQENFSNIVRYYTEKEKIKRLTLQIQKDMLSFSRRHNLPFERNWDTLLGFTLFSPRKAVKQASKELFLLELNGSDNLLERAIQIFRVNCDDTYIGEFIDIFKSEENFETCDKLFQLLKNNISDTGMCTVIILLINAVADDFRKDLSKYDQLVSLMNDIFGCIPFLQWYPNHLYRLINIINIEQFKDDTAFRDQFMVAENYILNAFYQSDNYGTAIGLLETLKRIGFDDDKVSQIFESLLERQGAMNNKIVFYLFMAATDTFNIFHKVHPEDKYTNFVWFHKCFENARDPEIKGCYIALIVNILAAYVSTPNIPNMDTNIIQAEASKVYAYLTTEILDKGHTQFTYMNLGTAFCILYAAFPLPDEKVLACVTSKLGERSFSFKQRFHVDSREDAEYDFRLITKFWTSLTTLYTKPRNLNVLPVSLFQYYINTEIHLKPYVEAFILRVIDYGSIRYRIFADTVKHFLVVCKPACIIKTMIRNLFDLVRSSGYACKTSAIALQLFLTILDVVRDGKRFETVKDVQTGLYVTYLTQQDRDFVVTAINQRCTNTDTKVDEKNRYKMLLKELQKSNGSEDIPPADASNTTRGCTDLVATFGTNEPSSSRTTATFTRRTSSLPPINFSFSLQ